MSYSLLKYKTIDEVSNYNYNIINSYIIKLGIEISYFETKMNIDAKNIKHKKNFNLI
jgi:hypothetical protein